MPKDLNVKKSWHPALQKNRAKVRAKEEAVVQERKKLAERQKEIEHERELLELQALQGKAPKSKVDWMYKTEVAPESIDKESYLLGKSQTKTRIDESRSNAKSSQPSSAKPVKDESRKSAADPMAKLFNKPYDRKRK